MRTLDFFPTHFNTTYPFHGHIDINEDILQNTRNEFNDGFVVSVKITSRFPVLTAAPCYIRENSYHLRLKLFGV